MEDQKQYVDVKIFNSLTSRKEWNELRPLFSDESFWRMCAAEIEEGLAYVRPEKFDFRDPGVLTYLVEDHEATAGDVVEVPFGKRNVRYGVVLPTQKQKLDLEIEYKPINSVVEPLRSDLIGKVE